MIQEVDLQDKGGIQVERYYHSRSLREGLLGIGWCLTIENKIEHVENDALSLFDCREGKKLLFHKTSPSRWALGNQTISKQGGQFSRQVVSNAQGSISIQTEIYSLDGKLKLPKELKVTKSKNELVIETKKQAVTYHLPMNRLMSVASGKGKEKTRIDEYSYDQFVNLTQTKTLAVKYDWTNDRVTQIIRAGCQENYNYTTEQNSKRILFHSEVTKSCPKQTSKTQRFEFEYEQNGGSYSLKRYQTFNSPARLALERSP